MRRARTAASGLLPAGLSDLTLEEIRRRYNVIADSGDIDCECTGKELKCTVTDDGGGKQKVHTGVPCGKNVRPTK